MKRLIFLLLLLPVFSLGQEKFTLSGYLKDASSGETLIGAKVYITELQTGAVTNNYGFYSVTVPSGSYTIIASYIGYEDIEKKVELIEDTRLNIELTSTSEVMEEVVITDELADENTKSTDMGRIEMDVAQIKEIPAFMGEVDILKTVQLLPGVQSGNEGSAGYYVRGGGPDQNLILLDEATVYNAGHLFGFFSVFNADAIKNVNLIKGGMPANYGGRVASVLDITMKDGNFNKYQAEGGIGLISSRLTVQGPIKKDTSSFIISGRRTYIDVLMKPFISEESNFSGSGYYFYDLNTKMNYRFTDKDRLYLSGYFGRDVFTFNSSEAGFSTKIPWGNATGSVRWNHLFNDKLFMNTTAIFSDYNFSFEATQSEFEFKLLSGIRDWNAKVDLSYFPTSKHNIKFGGNYTWHIFTPSSVSARSGDTEFDTGEITKMYAHESGFYVLDDFELNQRWAFNIGMRYSAFWQVGPFTRYVKDEVGSTTSEIEYDNQELVQFYQGFEPRFSTRYIVDDVSSVKASIVHNYQYVNLASISAVSLPTDVWFPASDIVKPQVNTQGSVGYFRNFFDNTYETSIELYYKDMKNLIEYKEGAEPEDNVKDNVDNQLVFGDGYSYGAELFIKKRTGDFTGWIGYTWSRTMRIFDAINDGEEFPAKYDRRHDLSVVGTYHINDRITLGAAFVYGTGNAITLPIGRYVIEGNLVNEYGPRNSFRMASYHRADISATFDSKHFKVSKDPDTGKEIKMKKKLISSWVVSVYNIYNRANPYFIYFDNEGSIEDGTLDISAKQVSLFPILPSVTWNFKFN